ncbi:binding partner of ACD11 1-like [Phoenix dactylifera]|uniref:Binding partner of ACD11 1-like n=1 Tax=Phoenix dactylifera TaxID=42345 RepID=A0A8B9ANJ6_PHODC|nr:binding partner of ACD11 1-like [Phoenix dactylifera]
MQEATIADLCVSITPVEDYQLPPEAYKEIPEGKLSSTESAVRKAEDVVSSMLAKGFVLSKDALKRARSFDERHHFMSGASAMALVPWRISLELLGNHHSLLPLQVKPQSCTRVKTF